MQITYSTLVCPTTVRTLNPFIDSSTTVISIVMYCQTKVSNVTHHQVGHTLNGPLVECIHNGTF